MASCKILLKLFGIICFICRKKLKPSFLSRKKLKILNLIPVDLELIKVKSMRII